jgi:hypothetical protein
MATTLLAEYKKPVCWLQNVQRPCSHTCGIWLRTATQPILLHPCRLLLLLNAAAPMRGGKHCHAMRTTGCCGCCYILIMLLRLLLLLPLLLLSWPWRPPPPQGGQGAGARTRVVCGSCLLVCTVAAQAS